jgi:hypothetical protein
LTGVGESGNIYRLWKGTNPTALDKRQGPSGAVKALLRKGGKYETPVSWLRKYLATLKKVAH